MTSLLILKAMYNLSDEKLVEEHWEISAHFQYFGGQEHQKRGQPCAASDLVHFRHTDALRAAAPEPAPGLVIANLPFGARLGDDQAIAQLYPQLGQVLRERFADAQAALLPLADGRGRALGLRARRRYALRNGVSGRLFRSSVEVGQAHKKLVMQDRCRHSCTEHRLE